MPGSSKAKTSKNRTKPKGDSLRYIPPSVKYQLWGRAAGCCQYRGCPATLYKDDLTQYEFNSAYIAHIRAVSKGGERFDPILSPKLKASLSNLMLLCDKHHRLIDVGEPKKHPIELLEEMKAEAEAKVETISKALVASTKTQVLLFGARIGQQSSPLSKERALATIAADLKYPSSDPIELAVQNCPFQDHEEDYWKFHKQSLERTFAIEVERLKEKGQGIHFSVFGLAPMPLLMRLGTLLSDLQSVEVYQKHREPDSWAWKDEVEQDFTFECVQNGEEGRVALVLALSATVTKDRVESVLPHATIYQLTVANPHNDMMVSRLMLSKFRRIVRIALDRIKAAHGQQTQLHLFPAVPVSAAIEFGRVLMPKADVSILVFDQNNTQKSFILTFPIN